MSITHPTDGGSAIASKSSEHPTEIARQALRDAAKVEWSPWAALMQQFAAGLPARASQGGNITIDRATRDVLRWEVPYVRGADGEVLNKAFWGLDRERVLPILARANRLAALVDQLGWEEDDPRDEYLIDVDDNIVSWLGEILVDEEKILSGVYRGDEDDLVEAKRKVPIYRALLTSIAGAI